MDNLEIKEEQKIEGTIDLYKTILNNYHKLNMDEILLSDISIEDIKSQKDKIYTELNNIRRKVYLGSISPLLTVAALYSHTLSKIAHSDSSSINKFISILFITSLASIPLILLISQLNNTYKRTNNIKKTTSKEEYEYLKILQALNTLPENSKLMINKIKEIKTPLIESLTTINENLNRLIPLREVYLHLHTIGAQNNNAVLQELNNRIPELTTEKNLINKAFETLQSEAQTIIKEERNIAAIEIAKSYCSGNNKNILQKPNSTMIKKQQSTFPNNRLIFNQLKKYCVGINLS